MDVKELKNLQKLVLLKNSIKSLSLFAMVFGIFGQLVGLFSEFSAVKLGSVEVSPSLMIEGFRVSMIPSIYGTFIFCIGYLVFRIYQRSMR